MLMMEAKDDDDDVVCCLYTGPTRERIRGLGVGCGVESKEGRRKESIKHGALVMERKTREEGMESRGQAIIRYGGAREGGLDDVSGEEDGRLGERGTGQSV